MSTPGVIYDYKCNTCQAIFEHRHPMSYDGPVPCACGSNDTQKLISVPTSILDWTDSDSVHGSRRFRGRGLNRQVAGGQ